MSWPSEAWLVTAEGVINYAIGFEQNTAEASAGGADRAYFHDSSGADSFASRTGESWLVTAGGVVNYARYFDTYEAYATPGGNDVSYLYDSTGNDRLDGRDGWYRLTRAVDEVFGQGFGRVLADSGSGDDDILDVLDLDYLFTPTGAWEQVL